MTVTPGALAALCAAALCAGTIDAIAGGGGLITVPSLLWAGLPAQVAFGTNKGQSTFGSFSALVNFYRLGALDTRRAPAAFALGFVGSAIGATLLLKVPREVLRPVVLALLVMVAAVLALRRNLGVADAAVDRPPPDNAAARAAVISLTIGAYDGFFGPGTGTFLIIAAVTWLHESMARATANAKVVNFASNLAALAVFAHKGVVRWDVALPMAAAQFIGGALGARLAVKRGDRFVRLVVLAATSALVAKLAWDLAR
ncbi:MAG: TSUP family transporter [Polyangiales bacterium]